MRLCYPCKLIDERELMSKPGPDKTSADKAAPHRRGAETVLTHGGRNPGAQSGFVNTPVVRGSTVLFETLEDLDTPRQTFRYGRQGTPTTRAVADIVTALEGAHDTLLAPSGLIAITTSLLAVLNAGDEVLVTDSAYDPTRAFCTGTLARMGIATRFFDPRIGAGIADLMSPRTKAVLCESPGSLTFEVQDIPAIAVAARANGAMTIVDNSWATPLFLKPLALGADIVVHAGTKMFVGHSDAMLGTISATETVWPALARTHRQLGLATSPDDAYLAARGLRTLSIRMQAHQQRALAIAAWLETQPGIARVIHPGLPSHPDHALFRRDFTGSGSLFSILLDPAPRSALAAMVDGFDLFGMGYSWGGYESLVISFDCTEYRTATTWNPGGPALRFHIGLEDVSDLTADLERGFAAMKQTG